MAYNYLGLTNRVLEEFNEVQLDNTSFGSTQGFSSGAKNWINRSIVDIYTEEDTKWPFAYQEFPFTIQPNNQLYTPDTTAFSVDWDSFMLLRPTYTVTSLTQVAGVATVVTSTPHFIVLGDIAVIAGAINAAYNGTFTVTSVPTSTSFTYNVSSATPSPDASASITARPNFAANPLDLIDYPTYKKYRYGYDLNAISKTATPNSYSPPTTVVRKPNNSFFLTPVPDRQYPAQYSAFIFPTSLSAYSDIPAMPSQFEQCIVDKALHYAYMFRDNIEEAGLAQDRYKKNVDKMRRILIPQTEYISTEG